MIRGHWLVLGLLSAIVLASVTYAVTAQQDEAPQLSAITAVPAGNPGDLPVVTKEESARAREALAADQTFKSLTRDTGWNVVQDAPNVRDGAKIGVALIVELDRPVNSDGPWRQFRCQGTVIHEYRLGYTGIKLLGAVFNSDGSQILALTPLAPASDQPLQFEPGVGITPPKCPLGFEEDTGY